MPDKKSPAREFDYVEKLRRLITDRVWTFNDKMVHCVEHGLARIESSENVFSHEEFLPVATAAMELQSGKRRDLLIECYRKLGFDSIPLADDVPKEVITVIADLALTYLGALRPPLDTRLGKINRRIIEMKTA